MGDANSFSYLFLCESIAEKDVYAVAVDGRETLLLLFFIQKSYQRILKANFDLPYVGAESAGAPVIEFDSTSLPSFNGIVICLEALPHPFIM